MQKYITRSIENRIDFTLKRVIKRVEKEIQDRALSIVDGMDITEVSKMKVGTKLEAQMKKDIISELLNTI